MHSPLFEAESKDGASFVTCQEWDIADHFGNARAEYEAVRSGVAAFDMSYVGKLRVTGRDRARYLHNMVSNDIKGLKGGAGCYATLLTHQGRMESDLYVYSFEDCFFLECPPSGTRRCLETLGRYIVADDVAIEDRTSALCIISLQGPGSKAAMERTLSASLDGVGLLQHRSHEGASGKWVVTHRDRTGCDGYDLWLPSQDATAVWGKWLEIEKIVPAGHRALDWLRTEAGIPWYGVDMDDKNLPQELGLQSAISLTKGCYRGQEIVARVHYRGRLDRQLGAVAIRHDSLPAKGSPVSANGGHIGEVTSSIPSPLLGCPLALCIMKGAPLPPGSHVDVAYGDSTHPGEVVSLPLRG